MVEPEQARVVEVSDLTEWTTGYCEEQGLVALILRSADGEEFGVVMPPSEALAMGAQLSELGLRFTSDAAHA